MTPDVFIAPGCRRTTHSDDGNKRCFPEATEGEKGKAEQVKLLWEHGHVKARVGHRLGLCWVILLGHWPKMLRLLAKDVL